MVRINRKMRNFPYSVGVHVTIWSLWQVIESMPIKSWATLVTLWSNNLVVSCLSWRKHETDFRTFSPFGCNSNWVISSASNSIWILWITHWWIRITFSNIRYILAKSKYGMFQQVLDRDLAKIYIRDKIHYFQITLKLKVCSMRWMKHWMPLTTWRSTNPKYRRALKIICESFRIRQEKRDRDNLESGWCKSWIEKQRK